jgi:hypothetical protein
MEEHALNARRVGFFDHVIKDGCRPQEIKLRRVARTLYILNSLCSVLQQ